MVAVGNLAKNVDASFFSTHDSAYTCSRTQPTLGIVIIIIIAIIIIELFFTSQHRV